MRDDDLTTTLTLAMLPGIGPRIWQNLMQQFGSPAAALQASEHELAAVSLIGPKLIGKIRHAADHVDVATLLQWCRQHSVAIVSLADDRYPAPLRQLVDAPPVLFVDGYWSARDQFAVAIVGTRHATTYGRDQAEKIGYGLARAGVTVVSGMARGIDTAAHQGAMDGGGRTLAVYGSGLGHVYPPENEALSRAIAGHGALISEYHPLAKPHSGAFPQRNRLISGLCHATLVIEAPERSGSLITARTASEQGRDVLALPGPVNSRASQGTNLLIRDGATLVRHVDDILECLGPLPQPAPTADGRQLHRPAEILLNDRERTVLDAIATDPTSIDKIVHSCGLPVAQVLATISVLEIRKLVRRHSSQFVARL